MKRRRAARAGRGRGRADGRQLRLRLQQRRGLAERGAHQRLLVQHLAVGIAVAGKEGMQRVERLPLRPMRVRLGGRAAGQVQHLVHAAQRGREHERQQQPRQRKAAAQQRQGVGVRWARHGPRRIAQDSGPGLQVAREGLAELRHLRPHDEGAVALVGVVGEVVLVVVLGRPVAFQLLQLRHHGRAPLATLLQLAQQVLGHLPVRGVGVVDGAAVLRAHVVALAVGRGGIVGGEEDFEDLAHADPGRVEGDAHHLGMARIARAHLLVRGRGHMAVGVAALHVGHAAHAVEHGLGAPKTPPSQGDNF